MSLSDKGRKIFGNNILWCNKSLISGERYIHMLFSFILFTIPYVCFNIVLAKININYSSVWSMVIISILYLMTIFALLRGGFTDPGILPRQKEELAWNPKKSIVTQFQNGQMINMTYCYSCFLFRPPRTSHCAVCDNCVERFDHHCIWLGNCIGKRNYKFFYLFVFLLDITALFEIGYCSFLIYNQYKGSNQKEDITISVVVLLSIVVFFDLMFVLFFLGKLFILHSYLILSNQTFYEHFKKKWILPPFINPFYKSTWIHFYSLIIKITTKALLNIKEAPNNLSSCDLNEDERYEIQITR